MRRIPLNQIRKAPVSFLTAVTALALAFQQGQQLPPSPVKRVELTPATRNVTAGDSVKLSARALGADGRALSNAAIAITLRAGDGEGTVRPESGMLIASSVGKFPLQITATVPGTQPFVDTTYEFHGVPGPATRLDVNPRAATIVVGQTLHIAAVPFSAANDHAVEALRWQSSAPAVVAVDRDGIVTGVAAGQAQLTVS